MGRSEEPGLGAWLGLGSTVVALVLGGMGLGALTDRGLDSFPVGTLAGLGLGILASCVFGYVQLKRFLQE